MNLTKQKKKKGFTLIELMAVIAIIAILAAVLVPTVSGYITRAKKTAVITQCRSVMNAIETYDATNGDTSIVKDWNKTITQATASGGQLEQLLKEELLEKSDYENIANAKLIDIKTINENKDGDIINKISMDGSNFKSLKK